MLQVAFLRNNTELVKQKLAVKNFIEIKFVDEVLQLDDERKRLQLEFENTQFFHKPFTCLPHLSL